MSEELLSNDRGAEKHLTTPGFDPLTSRSLTTSTAYLAIRPLSFPCCNRFHINNKLYFGVSDRDHSKIQNESVKKSLERSKNIQEKRKNCQVKNLH